MLSSLDRIGFWFYFATGVGLVGVPFLVVAFIAARSLWLALSGRRNERRRGFPLLGDEPLPRPKKK